MSPAGNLHPLIGVLLRGARVRRVFITGEVTNNEDEAGLGRVKVKLHGFPEQLETPWLRYMSPYASDKGGYIFLPDKGDEVVVLSPVFGEDIEDVHLSSMVVLGSLYNGAKKPKYEAGGNKTGNKFHQIKTPSGHALVFDDKASKITLMAKSTATSIVMDGTKSEITIKAGGSTIKIGKDISIDAAMNVKINAKMNAQMAATMKATVAGKLGATLDGSPMKAEVKGAIGVDLTAVMIALNGMTQMG